MWDQTTLSSHQTTLSCHQTTLITSDHTLMSPDYTLITRVSSPWGKKLALADSRSLGGLPRAQEHAHTHTHTHLVCRGISMRARLFSRSCFSSCDITLMAQMAIASFVTEAPSFQPASPMAASNRFTDLAVVYGLARGVYPRQRAM